MNAKASIADIRFQETFNLMLGSLPGQRSATLAKGTAKPVSILE